MSKLLNRLKYIRRNGIIFALRELFFRFCDRFYDNYFGVSTGNRPGDNDGLADKEHNPYSSIHYKNLFFLFNQISNPKNYYTMLDYGCGKGRAIAAAASYDFRKIIGLEFPHLITVAQTNLNNMKRRKTKSIEFVAIDARYYDLPPAVNLIYFYNPFTGSVLQSVIEKIRLSLQKHPRKLIIIYINNDHFDKAIMDQSWITKKKHGRLLPFESYGLYESI